MDKVKTAYNSVVAFVAAHPVATVNTVIAVAIADIVLSIIY